MAKKEEAKEEKKDETASASNMPDMAGVLSMAKNAFSFVQTQVMSLVECCKKKCCAAKAAADPPEDPPQVTSGFHGFLVTPYKRDSHTHGQQNSGQVVRA